MESYIDYPSSMKRPKWSAKAYELTASDKQNIFAALREQVDHGPCGDMDGAHYLLDYRAFLIEAVHHYEVHEERGGDSYMGFFERCSVVDRDSIEIVKITDEEGRSYPGIVQTLNQYAKQKYL